MDRGGVNQYENCPSERIPSFLIYVVTDYENRKILYYSKVDKILRRKYLKYANTNPDGLRFGECPYTEPIWVYWKQGITNAPGIVKKCIETIHEWADRLVIEIDETSISKYVILPKTIIQKYDDGKISDAALSDLIRFSLLEHFGGLWLDATVLLTGKIPENIINSDFFAFQDSFGKIDNPALISNWLLHCKPGHPIMKNARNMAFAYWENESHVMEYLFTYILLKIAVEISRNNCGFFPYCNSDYTHQYLNSLAEEFTIAKAEHIKRMTPIHKLTYKLSNEVNDGNTFYMNLMRKDVSHEKGSNKWLLSCICYFCGSQ